MPNIKSYLFLLIFIFSSIALYSQNNKGDIVLEDLVEDIASNTDEDVDYTEIYDDLEFFLNNKINLNTATEDELKRLHFLDQIRIDSILMWKEKVGFKSETDLYLLGFSYDEVETLLNFVYIGDKKEEVVKFNPASAFKWGSHEIYFRTNGYLEPMVGYNIPDSVIEQNPDKSRYLGSPIRLYTKYKFHYKNFVQWGFTAEKDPGEQFFKGSEKYGFDYYSAHLQLENIWRFKRVVIGDFQAQFGEGLTLWTGLSFGKSALVSNVKKNGRGIKKYSSTDENNFLRGVGMMMDFGDFTLSAFGSYHKIDAGIGLIDTLNLDYDVLQITSIQNSGYHRTPTEIANRHSIGQTVFGGNISYSNNFMKSGITFVNYNFSADLVRNLKPYEYFDFQGNSIYNVGWNYEFSLDKFHFFGESSMSSNIALATIDGVYFSPEQRIRLVALYRNYSMHYQSMMTAALAEGSDNQNEKGLYVGMSLYPAPSFEFSAYVDSYTFPWLDYRINSTKASGYEYLTQLKYNPNGDISMYLRFKHEIKPQNISEELPIKYPVNTTRWNLRYHISYQITQALTLSNRIEFSGYEKDKSIEKGFMVYQDVKFKPKTTNLTLYFRYAIFDAPYDARIYAYENDVLYAFSIPGYFYKGYRTYVTAKYDITKHLTAWIKASRFGYSDRTVLSEGSLNEINGNTKTQINFELRYKF